ncbi:Panacea domain-containing protein [Bosea sp. BH3]|uniref:Panacea domain-containing protein n=1 Tax=Bosea sp. BH3 TaxID=2871701 RepID=UPI0021CAFF21|nr:Panacea domain-containing protein [Bosea sp. BH3]MCU4182674.1 SocA family protein [Bosea sp. BH3]
MNVNLDRIVEAILHVVNEGKRLHKQISQYDIVKTLFLADKAHLNKFGRPVTFDMYYAMKHGPVPSTSYDVLKINPKVQKAYGKDFPWKRTQAGQSIYSFSLPEREASDDILSESDKESLAEALGVVKALGFSQIRRLTHEDPAYIDAWEDDGPENSSYKMSYGMLFETPNMERAKELSFLSNHL